MAATDTMVAPGAAAFAPLVVKPEQAAIMLQMSRAKVYQMMASGELPSIKSGGNRRIELAALHDYIARLRSEGNGTAR